MLTAEQIAQKQINNASTAAASWDQAMQALTVSPTQQAATEEAQNKARINYVEASNSGRTQAALQRVDIGTYKAACKSKSGNYSTGINAARNRITAYWQKNLGVYKAAKDLAAQMPSATYEQRKARAAAVMDFLHQKKGTMGVP